MRPVREITSDMENFRVEPAGGRIGFIRRDPVEPEPVGTIVLKAFRIAGYDQDCDGSLMAQLEAIDKDGDSTGWTQDCIGLCSASTIVVSAEELRTMFGGEKESTNNA